MIQFFRNYFTDAYYLLTFRQRVPVRVGTSLPAFLLCFQFDLVFLIADALLAENSTAIGSALTITTMLAMAWFCWRHAPGMFICFSIVNLFTGLAGWVAYWLTHHGLLSVSINVFWFIAAMWRYQADLDDPKKQRANKCPSN